MTLLSWNVAGRVQRQPEQAALIADLGPDLVCLPWMTALKNAGWPHIALAGADTPTGDPDRRLAVLTAAREPLTQVAIDGDLPWPERVLATRIDGLEVVNFHSPISPKPFRELHGYERRELSWQWQRWGGGYRLDHLIVSDDVEVSRVEYLHEWRQATGRSDHSPLAATLDW